DFDSLHSAGCAAGYGNGGAGNFKKFREEIDHCLVGAAIDWGRGQRELERFAHFAGNGILPRPWMYLHGKGNAAADFPDRYHDPRLAIHGARLLRITRFARYLADIPNVPPKPFCIDSAGFLRFWALTEDRRADADARGAFLDCYPEIMGHAYGK